MIELSFKKCFQFKNEVKVLGKNLGHERSGYSEQIKCRRIEKTKCDRIVLQKKIQSKSEVKLGFSRCIRNTKDQGLRVGELKKQSTIKLSFKKFFSL